MVKKINQFGATCKTLLSQGYTQSWIARKLKVKRQNVNYWAKHPLKTEQKKRRKLPEKYLEKIKQMAANKTTSSMSSSRIASIINDDLVKDKLDMSIHRSTVARILKKEFGSPRRIKKVFYLTDKQKKQRLNFCKDILKKKIKGE